MEKWTAKGIWWAPVLVALDLDKKFRIKVGISNYTTGEVLSMKYSNKL